MKLKLIIKYYVIACLLSCSLSVFAFNDKIKCPSSNFVKSTYSDTLYKITRYNTDDYRFGVDSWYSYYEASIKLEWTLHIYVNTAQDYNFNEAFKNAQYALTNIGKVENDYADDNPVRAECRYLDTNGKSLLILVADKSRFSKP